MGGILSSGSAATRDEKQKLIQRLEKLDRIDLDNNGIISKEEFEKWKANDLEMIKKSLKEDLQREMVETVQKHKDKEKQYKSKVNQLSEDISLIKMRNNQLEIELKEKTKMLQELNTDRISSELSKHEIGEPNNIENMLDLLTQHQIDNYVEELLKDEKYNSPWIPDFAERLLKANILKLVFKLLKKILSSASVEFVNHKLSLTLIPKSELK